MTLSVGVRGLLVVSVIYLVAAVVLDLIVWPDHNIPILYGVPILLTTFAESAMFVVAMSALVIVIDLVSILISKPPLGLWPFTLGALLVVCYLALQVGGQRAIIRRQAEEAAHAKWNTLLLADVAHELRTPLTVILGYAQMVRQNPSLPGPLYKPMTFIERAALQMRVNIDDLAHRWEPGEQDQT